MLKAVVQEAVDEYLPAKEHGARWDVVGLCAWARWKGRMEIAPQQIAGKGREQVRGLVVDRFNAAYEGFRRALGPEAAPRLERRLILERVDSNWRDHIRAMGLMESRIALLRGRQRAPEIEYNVEGHALFAQMTGRIGQEVTEYILRYQHPEAGHADAS